MKILYIFAENGEHQPYEVLAFNPDPENQPKDYLLKGFDIIETKTIELDETIWSGLPTSGVFVNESYL